MKTTTATKRSPRKSAHWVGDDELSSAVTKLRPTAPRIGPSTVARPPTATQIRICVEKRKSNSCDETNPSIIANIPPAPAAIIAPPTNTISFISSTLTPKKRTRRSLSRIARMTRPKSLRTRTSAPAATTTRTAADT